MDLHQINVGELRAFNTFLKKYRSDLEGLDRQLTSKLQQVGTTWTDKAYQQFRSHVEGTLLKQHKEDLTKISQATAVLDQLIREYEQIEATNRRLSSF